MFAAPMPKCFGKGINPRLRRNGSRRAAKSCQSTPKVKPTALRRTTPEFSDAVVPRTKPGFAKYLPMQIFLFGWLKRQQPQNQRRLVQLSSKCANGPEKWSRCYSGETLARK